MSPFIIKICGITNEEDAELAVSAGANAIGFNFYPKSPRYISPARARQIVAAINKVAVLKVGIFVNPSQQALDEISAQIDLDVLQFHGECTWPSVGRSPWTALDAPSGSTASLTERKHYRVWKSHPASDRFPPPDPRIEAYLLDTPTPAFGGSGRTFNWHLAARFPYRMLIAGGLDGTNVAAAIQAVAPWGVDACSRLESAPGKKDPERVRCFVEAASAAFRQPSTL